MFTRLPSALLRATRLQHLCLSQNKHLEVDSAAVCLLASLPALAQVELPHTVPDRLIKRLEEGAHAQNLKITVDS